MHRPVLRKRMFFSLYRLGVDQHFMRQPSPPHAVIMPPSRQHHAPLLIPNASVLNPQSFVISPHSFVLNPSQFSVLTKSHHITQENTQRKFTNLRKNNIFS